MAYTNVSFRFDDILKLTSVKNPGEPGKWNVFPTRLIQKSSG